MKNQAVLPLQLNQVKEKENQRLISDEEDEDFKKPNFDIKETTQELFSFHKNMNSSRSQSLSGNKLIQKSKENGPLINQTTRNIESLIKSSSHRQELAEQQKSTLTEIYGQYKGILNNSQTIAFKKIQQRLAYMKKKTVGTNKNFYLN